MRIGKRIKLQVRGCSSDSSWDPLWWRLLRLRQRLRLKLVWLGWSFICLLLLFFSFCLLCSHLPKQKFKSNIFLYISHLPADRPLKWVLWQWGVPMSRGSDLCSHMSRCLSQFYCSALQVFFFVFVFVLYLSLSLCPQMWRCLSQLYCVSWAVLRIKRVFFHSVQFPCHTWSHIKFNAILTSLSPAAHFHFQLNLTAELIWWLDSGLRFRPAQQLLQNPFLVDYYPPSLRPSCSIFTFIF